MSEGFIETLETKIDTNKNLKLEEQEILDFIKEEENLQALGKELQNICHQSPDRLGNFGKIIKSICEKILQKGGESIDQIRILMFFKEYAGKQFPEINKQIQTFINRKHLEQEIDQATTEALQNSIKNLQELGIDTRIIPNWSLLFKTIKHPQDLSRITLKNLTDFLPLPNTIAPENLPYILANFQEIIAEHLHINPAYLSFVGNNGRATGTSLEQTSKGNQYRKTILHNIESIHRKKNLQEKIAYALKSGDIFELWLKKEISSLKGEAQIQAKISKIFTILDDQQTEILLSFMHNKEKNDSKSFLGGLKEVLFHTYLEKKNAYTTTIEKEQILTPEGIDILTPLLKKYGSKAFESLVENSKIINTFYTEAEKLGFSRAIARNDIINLYSKSQATIQEINKLEEDFTKTKNERNKYFYPTTSYGVSTRTIQDGVDGSITAKKKHELMVNLAEAYATVLLKDPNNRGKIITAPAELGSFTLDFSKGQNPQDIVRDSFGENISDQRDLFVDNLKNDKQAAFGSLCGMVGGCTLAGASVFSGNIWATSAGFTAGLKIGNGLGQEVWNGGEYLYTKRGGSLEGTYNQVDKFGNSFLRGIGSHEFKRDQNGNLIKDHNGKIEQEFIGWDKVAMNLGFDYLSTLATFGLSQKFKGMISQIAQVKGIGQGLKFGFEELVLENFFVDIPMNIVQTGVGTLTGIDSKIKTGQTALGNKEGTPTHTSYQSNSLSDMLSAMKEATEENLSFENLSQTFFSTIIYGGLLEGGGAAINKIKSYLPQNQVINFEHSSKAATLALGELKNFMSQNKLSFNKEGHCIDTVSKQPLLPSNIKTKELMKHLQNIEATKKIHLETLEAIQKTHKSMLEDPESKPGLLFKLGLLSSTNTPLNILEKKLTLCEQKIEQAKQKGDQKTVRQLEQLKAEYLKVKAMLSEPSSQINTNQDTGKNEIELPSAYFGGKISKFGLSEAQARENSQWMDKILSTINENNQAEQLQLLNTTISKQYQEITRKEGQSGREIKITQEQALFLIDPLNKKGWKANYPDGTYGSFEQVFPDTEQRNFILKSGFATWKNMIEAGVSTDGKLLDLEIGNKKGKKLFQGFEKKFSNLEFEQEVDNFISWAKEKEIAHFAIMEDIEKVGVKLYKGPAKRKERIVDKIKNEYLPEGRGLDALTDYTRATLVFDKYSDFGKGLMMLHTLVAQGKLANFNVKNRVDGGCADMLINLQTSDGYVSEIQFHIPESLIMKEVYLGNEIIQHYKILGKDLQPVTLTKELFDFSLTPFTDIDYKILSWVNHGRENQFSFPEQDQIIYTHNLYDITRLLPQNINDFIQKIGFGLGFDYSDIQKLNAKLSKISDNITIFSLHSHKLRTQ